MLTSLPILLFINLIIIGFAGITKQIISQNKKYYK